jgi:ribose-phosphate pyrophosphokinase
MPIYYESPFRDRPTLVPFSLFPNGEQNVPEIKEEVSTLILKWESDKDLISLLLLQSGVLYSKVRLKILYMPYSRMDRGENSSKCSLRYVGDIIRGLNFKSIEVIDPHSDLTLAYLGENAFGRYPFQETIHEPFVLTDIVVFPDAGAQKRYGKGWKGVQLVANKKRDFATGKITGYSLENSSLVKGKHVTIIDDLSSKGTTFLFAGKALREFEPKHVDLVVTHCENSIYQGELLKPDSPIDRIYTTNSILTDFSSDKITVYDAFDPEFPCIK